MLLIVINKWGCLLDNITLTTALEWDRLFIFFLLEWIYVFLYTSWKIVFKSW